MKHWTRVAAALAGGAGISAAVAVAAGALVWRRATARALTTLNNAAAGLPQPTDAPADVARLPAPVRRYLEYALPPGHAHIQSARVLQQGAFRIGGFNAKWSPLTAVQHFTAQPPGFLWDAQIQMAAAISVHVRDSYIAGAGAMQAKIAALIPVVDQRGGPEMAAGALHRYLAETVWLPTALLPGHGVVWQAIDDTSARATLTDGRVSVSLDFRFGDDGAILSAYTPERYRDVGGVAVKTPWICYYAGFTRVNGMMIPLEGETAWLLPEGQLSYCRLRVRAITFDERPEADPNAIVSGLMSIQDFLHSGPREKQGSRQTHAPSRNVVSQYAGPQASR